MSQDYSAILTALALTVVQCLSLSSMISGSGGLSSSSPSEECAAATGGFLSALNAWFSFSLIYSKKQ